MCVPHTINNAGKRVTFPLLEEFMEPFLKLMSSAGAARSLWKKIIGKEPKHLSEVRWYSRAEIMMELAENWGKVADLISGLQRESIGSATTDDMARAWLKDPFRMAAEAQATLDVYLPLVKCCYDLEGDRLEILLARRRIDELISLESRFGEAGGMLKLEAYIRDELPLDRLSWPRLTLTKEVGSATWTGAIQSVHKRTVNGQEGQYFKVKFSPPGGPLGARPRVEELVESDVRQLLAVHDEDLYKQIAQLAAQGPRYLKDRMTGNCATPYDCKTMYAMLECVQIFDPGYVKEITEVDCRKHLLAVCNLPFMIKDDEPMKVLPDDYKHELGKYCQSAQAVTIKRDDVADFTKDVLSFWRARVTELPLLSSAARKICALSPNSAACERVFSILKATFSDTRTSALADVIQTTLMLRYNARETD